MTVYITGNTYPVKDQLKALGGRWDAAQKAWGVPDHNADAARALVPAPTPQNTTMNVGDMREVIALFDRAKVHLRFPAIVLASKDTDMIRLNVAGDQARVPGSINVASYEKRDSNDRRLWYGRVHRDGTYEGSRNADPAIAQLLTKFAANPAKVAKESAHLTARCCFCNLPLGGKDPSVKPSKTALRSLAVGYGKTCAENFGMPWGEEGFSFEAAA